MLPNCQQWGQLTKSLCVSGSVLMYVRALPAHVHIYRSCNTQWIQVRRYIIMIFHVALKSLATQSDDVVRKPQSDSAVTEAN